MHGLFVGFRWSENFTVASGGLPKTGHVVFCYRAHRSLREAPVVYGNPLSITLAKRPFGDAVARDSSIFGLFVLQNIATGRGVFCIITHSFNVQYTK